MVILARPIIEAFIKQNPLSARALNDWYVKTKKSDWSNISELHQVFNSCDSIGNDRYIFNIAGNNYRLLAIIHFSRRTLYIRRIMTHAEYEDFSKKGKL